jgi:hypothetical protein
MPIWGPAPAPAPDLVRDLARTRRLTPLVQMPRLPTRLPWTTRRLLALETLLARPQATRIPLRCQAWLLAPVLVTLLVRVLAPVMHLVRVLVPVPLLTLQVRALGPHLVRVRPILRLLVLAPLTLPVLAPVRLLVRAPVRLLALALVRPILRPLAPALVRVPALVRRMRLVRVLALLLVRAPVRVLVLALVAAVDRKVSILVPIIRTWRDRSTGILLRSCGCPISAAR